MQNRIPKARVYYKGNQYRFNLYGKTHYIKHVNDRGIKKLQAIIQSGDNKVDAILETPNYEVDSKAIIGGVACHVEYVSFPENDIHLTEKTPMTFELIERVCEHDEFVVEKDEVLFSDKGLVIKWANGLYRFHLTLNENEVSINGFSTDENNKVVSDNKVSKGSAIAIMRLIEDSGLEWNSMQERIENTEEYALDYLEEFCCYVAKVFEDGTIF